MLDFRVFQIVAYLGENGKGIENIKLISNDSFDPIFPVIGKHNGAFRIGQGTLADEQVIFAVDVDCKVSHIHFGIDDEIIITDEEGTALEVQADKIVGTGKLTYTLKHQPGYVLLDAA